MAKSLLSTLSKKQQQQLLDDLNYLNTAEIKSFCEKHSLPYAISIATENGKRRTAEDDRKGIILDRIRDFLKTGAVLPETCFPAEVVCFDPLPEKLTKKHRLLYGQYDKTNPGMISLLKSLTGGKFKNGAIARILAREFWSKGVAPTFEEFASSWLKAEQEHTRPNPEWAFLSDIARKAKVLDWKKLRAKKAANALKLLDRIISKNRVEKLKSGNRVVLTAVPPGLLDGLPEEDQLAIREAAKSPLRFNEYSDVNHQRAELEFRDRVGNLHFIFADPKFVKPLKSTTKHLAKKKK